MKKILLLFVALLVTTTVWAANYITDVMVIGGSKSEVNSLKTTYTNQGWTVIDQDLNAGCGSSSDYIYLLYKSASETSTSATFITDFLISTATTPPNSFMNNGRVYTLVSYDGSDYFKNNKGDLNSHCGSSSAYIHLYYTKDYADDLGTVRSITFNATQAGGVPVAGGSTGYDLNAGAGGDYIYMHAEKSQGWTYTKNSAGTQCYINGYDGPKANITSITIPTTLDGAQVANFTGSVFSGFTNLETMIFNENTIVSQMPSVNGLTKFKNVKTSNSLSNNNTPPSMTSIPASTFEGTAVMVINLTAVTSIGNYAFKGCSSLKDVYVSSTLNTIGKQVFYNCSSMAHLWFNGTEAQWNAVSKDSQWRTGAANFTEHWRCTVTFNANGHGTAPAAQTVWCKYDKVTEPTAPTAPLCTFQGWYTDAACTNQWNFNTIVTGDMTLYAKWNSQYTFNSSTGALTLNWGEFNKDNKWGSDVPASAVQSVTATSQVSFTGDCSELFYNFSNCTSMDLNGVNTSNVTNMSSMFQGCGALNTLNLSNWNTGNVTNMSSMFQGCASLTTIYVTTSWSTANATNSSYMFTGCNNLVGGMGTTFDSNHTNKAYGRIDHGSAGPGYLTGVFTLTLPGDVTASPDPVCTLSGNKYYASGTTITLTYNGEVPEGKEVVFAVNGTAIKGNTFKMPLNDVTITATLTDLPRYTFNSSTGELALIWGEFNKDNKWGNDVSPSAVKSVTATSQVSFTGDCSQLFMGFVFCTSFDLNRVNTSNVTSMQTMFVACQRLTSLDLSGWDTGNVTDMYGMFMQCSLLNTLNISNFNTSKVTDMTYMFEQCTNLKNLDLSTWDTGNVTKMNKMFEKCESLDSLDLSNWDTGNVTEMTSMFYNCTNLKKLNVSGWDTGNVLSMWDMFHCCYGLETLDLSGWSTSEDTWIEGMFDFCHNLTTIYTDHNWSFGNSVNSRIVFSECYSLVGGRGTVFDNSHIRADYAHIDGAPTNPGYFTDPNALPRYTYDSTTGTLSLNWGDFNKDNKWGDDVPASEVTSVTATNEVSFTGDCSELFQGFSNCTSFDLNSVNTSNVTNMANLFTGCAKLTSIDLSNWDTGNVTNMYGLFLQCNSLDSLDISNFNTTKVTNMSFMFDHCLKLKKVNVSGWDTSNVTEMINLFCCCYCLKTLDLSGWSAGKVTKMYCMFAGNDSLTTIYADRDWHIGNNTSSSVMFAQCLSLVGDKGTTYDENHIDKEYARLDGGPDCPGYFSGLELPRYTYDSTTGTLSLIWGEFNKDDKWGDDVPASAVTSVTTTSNVSFTGDCSNLFYDFSNCVNMDFSGVNTANATNMGAMFSGCQKLVSLNLSGWNTGNVVDMDRMFYECISLDTLIISNWDTGNVTDVSEMFYNCNSLTSLDLSGWNTSEITNMERMFNKCSKLTTIYAGWPDWSTENVIYSDDMFKDCNDLVGCNGTTYDENHVDKEYARIDCSPDCPGYFTMPQYTFNSETGELSLIWGEFNRGNKWGDDVPVSEVTSVTANILVSFTGDCTELFYNFSNCTSMDFNSVNANAITNMYRMFNYCKKLKKLDLSGWDTGNVSNMGMMFDYCKSLTSLDLSGWSADNVTSTFCMFNECDSLTTIYADRDWNISSSANSLCMFYHCYNIVGGMGTTYSDYNGDAEYARIDRGPERPGYFTDSNPVVAVPGDVDGDGNVTAGDITALYNWILNGDGSLIVNGDQDGDGNITAGDVTLVYNILLGNSK